MANQIPKSQILSIYKQLLRESQKFDTYNFRWLPMWCCGQCRNVNIYFDFDCRMYALRRVRDAFKENKNTTDVQQQFKFANENLELIKRQVSVDFAIARFRMPWSNGQSVNIFNVLIYVFFCCRWLSASCIRRINWLSRQRESRQSSNEPGI